MQRIAIAVVLVCLPVIGCVSSLPKAATGDAAPADRWAGARTGKVTVEEWIEGNKHVMYGRYRRAVSPDDALHVTINSYLVREGLVETLPNELAEFRVDRKTYFKCVDYAEKTHRLPISLDNDCLYPLWTLPIVFAVPFDHHVKPAFRKMPSDNELTSTYILTDPQPFRDGIVSVSINYDSAGLPIRLELRTTEGCRCIMRFKEDRMGSTQPTKEQNHEDRSPPP